LNEGVLKELAEITNGVYTRLQSSDEAVKVMKGQLAQIDRKAFGDISLMNFTTYYYVFAGLMFLLLLVEPFIPEKRRAYAQ
jgi:Ca-activated chloride channel family protein